MVPLLSMKFRRCGICSRSDGTLGLSRKKWTLSKVICTTCCAPLPSEHVGGAVFVAAVTVLASGNPAAVANVVAAKTVLSLRAPDRNQNLSMYVPPGRVGPWCAEPTGTVARRSELSTTPMRTGCEFGPASLRARGKPGRWRSARLESDSTRKGTTHDR